MKYTTRWVPEIFSWQVVYEFPDGRWFNTSVPTQADLDTILGDPEAFYQKERMKDD